MENLKHFSLPLSGMKNGIHVVTFQINDSFFKEFENSLIEKGQFEARIEVEKSNNLIILHSEIKGFMETNCDRCLSDIKLPVAASNSIHVKNGDPSESDDEVMYVREDVTSLNVASLIYESLHVAIPLIKVYDCQSEEIIPCNSEILNFLVEVSDQNEEDDDSANVFSNIKL